MATTPKIIGAVGLGGQVYRAGREKELAKAAEAAGIDLTEDRFAAALAGEWGENQTGRGWDQMDKDDLVAEAEKRKLPVTRADGKDGEPLKSDFVAALEADDAK